MLDYFIVVFVGGAVGAMLREFIMLMVPNLADSFPLDILVANLVATFLLGLTTALPLPDWFDPEEALQFAAAQFRAGRIKFSAAALSKMHTASLGAAVSFRLADKAESRLQAALLAAISACCDERLTSLKRAA